MDLRAAVDPSAGGDAGVPHGAELLAFASAAHTAEQPDELLLSTAREALRAQVGEQGLAEAAATVAAFAGLVRVADGTGIQLDAGVLADSADFRAELGVDRFAGAGNTATAPVPVDRRSIRDLFA